MEYNKSRIVKNAFWIIACRVIQALLSFAIGMISARYLGPTNYGMINYAASVAAFVVPVVQLGLRNTLVQEIVACPEREGETLGTSLAMSASASLLGIVGIWTFVSIANRGDAVTVIVCVLYSVSLFFQMFEMIQYWFQAKLKSQYTSIVSLAAYAIVSAYRIFLLITGKSVYWFALSQTLDYLLISAILFVIYNKVGNQRLSVSVCLAKELFSRSKYYIVSGMMVSIFSHTDSVMLTIMQGEATNGYYAAAIACASISSFVFAAIIDTARPVIFESKKVAQSEFEKNISRLYSLIIYAGLLQSIVLTVFAKIVVEFIYGASYAPAISILRIITWYTAFSYMGTVRNIWILAENRQNILWIMNLSGAVLNVVGNFLLIPRMGANGAAIASVATQFFTNFVLCFIMKPIRPTVRLILRGLNPRLIFEIFVPDHTGPSGHEK